jgi:hypothetical protein
MDNKVLSNKIEVTLKDKLITLKMETQYGPIGFSYSPEGIKLELAKLASQLLQTLQSENPNEAEVLAKNVDVRLDKLMKHLGAFNETVKEIPLSALNTFYKDRMPYLEGTLEQFADNLPVAIVLMLSHLVSAAIMRTTVELDSNTARTIHAREAELLKMIDSHFKESIMRLWDNPSV